MLGQNLMRMDFFGDSYDYSEEIPNAVYWTKFRWITLPMFTTRLAVKTLNLVEQFLHVRVISKISFATTIDRDKYFADSGNHRNISLTPILEYQL